MFALFVLNQVIPAESGYITFGVSGFIGFLGIVLLLASPDYMSLSGWLGTYREFRNRPSEVEKTVATDGGIDSDGVSLSSEPDTREFTNLDEIYPREGTVLLEDGSMMGAVECGGLNLDTASGDKWSMYAEKFANWFNTQITYDIQLYMPMRRFDPTNQEALYLDRASDEDISGNPVLEEYVTDRATWMRATSSQSFIREFYVLVKVSKREVLSDEFDQGDLERNLNKVPGGEVMDDFIKGLQGTDTSSNLSMQEIKDRQIREVKRRQEEISGGLGLGGKNKVTPVDGDHLGVLLKEYWEGTTVREDEAENFVRKTPYVTGSDSVISAVNEEEE
jgi:hypothetical protein